MISKHEESIGHGDVLHKSNGLVLILEVMGEQRGY